MLTVPYATDVCCIYMRHFLPSASHTYRCSANISVESCHAEYKLPYLKKQKQNMMSWPWLHSHWFYYCKCYVQCVNSYSASHNNWCTATLWNRIITTQCEGMGDVGSARYEPALLPPCPSIRVLCYSNCQEIHPITPAVQGLNIVKCSTSYCSVTLKASTVLT